MISLLKKKQMLQLFPVTRQKFKFKLNSWDKFMFITITLTNLL